MLEVAVLLSVGCHRGSGRAVRAELDARALEMALGLCGPARIHAIHTGDPYAPALRDYLGMGIGELTVLAGAGDLADALAGYLGQLRPALVLSGSHAECGEASGMLPYRLAHALAMPLIANAVSIAPGPQAARVIQALPRGGRRALQAALPLWLTVDRAAPAARMSAYASARRGRIRVIEIASAGPRSVLPPQGSVDWCERPARARPRRLRALLQGSAAERLRSIQPARAGSGTRLLELAPDEAARAIWQYLVDEGLVDAGQAPGPTPGAPDRGTGIEQ